MSDKFVIKYTGQRNDIEEILLKYFSSEEINLMTDEAIEAFINENYVCYDCGEDWLIISKEKEKEFNRMVDWICR